MILVAGDFFIQCMYLWLLWWDHDKSANLLKVMVRFRLHTIYLFLAWKAEIFDIFFTLFLAASKAAVSQMTNPKFLVTNSISFSCILRFVNLTCLVVLLLTMRGNCLLRNKQTWFTNLWKLQKEILPLPWNFQLITWLTAANKKVTKNSKFLAFEARKKNKKCGG